MTSENEKLNSMCIDCQYLNDICSGTTSKVWTGCAGKNAPRDLMESYISSIQEDIDRQTAGKINHTGGLNDFTL